MPIFAYFAAVGLVLMALMFVTNATMEKGGPAIVTTQRAGLPTSQLPPNPTQILTSTPAPAPDMTSPLVLIAGPKAQPEVPVVVPAARAARAEAPPQHKRTGPRDFGLSGM